VRLLAAAVVLLQAPDRAELRSGLDTLYAGEFAAAAAHFERLAARDTTDPAALVFQAGAYIWWASAKDSANFERRRIDSLLALSIARARGLGEGGDFWRATALGYRARERDLHGQSWGAAKDGKAMRDGLARASALARLFARIIGLGSGNAETGIRYMRRVAQEGDLARVEATWVLAAALVREAGRDPPGRATLEREARGYVLRLAERYPGNPVFQRFLVETQ
jgi:hypothetical protein